LIAMNPSNPTVSDTIVPTINNSSLFPYILVLIYLLEQ